MAARTPRLPKRRVFIGCEGASEASYAALLQSVLDVRALPVALDVTLLNPGAGDPHEIVKKAAARADASARKRGEHAGRYVFLDMDRHAPASELGRRTLDLAQRNDLALIWQDPCHEALLLRHLPGCGHRRPITSADAVSALVRAWPTYSKPMSSRELASMIDEPAVLRAAQVESGLHGFLSAIGLIQNAGEVKT